MMQRELDPSCILCTINYFPYICKPTRRESACRMVQERVSCVARRSVRMYRSEKYPVDPEAVAAFVAGQRHGHLIATPPDGYPQVSILPFVKMGDEIELHCVQDDPTFAAVRVNPRVTF